MDAIELREGELYVAGHTEEGIVSNPSPDPIRSANDDYCDVALDEFELRLTPTDKRSALEVARRPDADDAPKE
jgi:hypothetical protein